MTDDADVYAGDGLSDWDARRALFADKVLVLLEEYEHWNADTLDEIASEAYALDLAGVVECRFRRVRLAEFRDVYAAGLSVEFDAFDRLPRVCAARLPGSQKAVLLRRGHTGYESIAARGFDVERFNSERGITTVQVEAMLCGSMFGWHAYGSDPAFYSRHEVAPDRGVYWTPEPADAACTCCGAAARLDDVGTVCMNCKRGVIGETS